MSRIKVRNVSVYRKAPTVKIEICSTSGAYKGTVTAIPDGVAEVSVISESLLEFIGEDMHNLTHRGVDYFYAAL